MQLARLFGWYAILRAVLYFYKGSIPLVAGAGAAATGSIGGVSVVVFGVLWFALGFGLMLSGGLLLANRKIGRILAILALTLDAGMQGLEGLATSSTFSLLWGASSLLIAGYLLFRNPIETGERPTIDEETSAHDIGFEKS